jgi:hypothetical protein
MATRVASIYSIQTTTADPVRKSSLRLDHETQPPLSNGKWSTSGADQLLEETEGTWVQAFPNIVVLAGKKNGSKKAQMRSLTAATQPVPSGGTADCQIVGDLVKGGEILTWICQAEETA